MCYSGVSLVLQGLKVCLGILASSIVQNYIFATKNNTANALCNKRVTFYQSEKLFVLILRLGFSQKDWACHKRSKSFTKEEEKSFLK